MHSDCGMYMQTVLRAERLVQKSHCVCRRGGHSPGRGKKERDRREWSPTRVGEPFFCDISNTKKRKYGVCFPRSRRLSLAVTVYNHFVKLDVLERGQAFQMSPTGGGGVLPLHLSANTWGVCLLCSVTPKQVKQKERYTLQNEHERSFSLSLLWLHVAGGLTS